MNSLTKSCFFCVLLMTILADSAEGQIIAPGEKLKLVADGYQFTEGPTADERGNVYFTDQPNNRIVHYDFSSGKAVDWLRPSGRSNGLFFAGPDRLIACADLDNELWVIHPETKSHRVLAKGFEGRTFCGPNDCWVDRDGTIFFTDPLYKRPYWTQTIPEDQPRGVYRVSLEGKISQVIDDLVQPNGIVGDAAKRLLFVADINANRTYRYVIGADGTLGDKQLFCRSGSDGMTIDEQGNVYLTGGRGVTVFNSSGEQIQTIVVPRGWTANVSFAGPDKRHLFITAGDAVFTIETIMRGL